MNVELPVLQDIKYRYLVVEKVQSNNSSGESINIVRWETTLHPRYCHFSLPGGHDGACVCVCVCVCMRERERESE